jgi:WS/DGAT/MGAT family acyltransferase
MRKLSGLDAAFLYLESPEAPMFVGGVYLFNGSTKDPDFDFEAFRDHIASRLHVSRTFRQRLVTMPLNLDHPYWIEDPDFDLNRHLHHAVLPEPGGRKELADLTETLFGQPLSRAHPLWEMTFVEGLNTVEGIPPNAFAIVAKAHHAAVDGVSGEEMMWALLDAAPQPKPPATPDPWTPAQIPGKWALFAKTAGEAIKTPFKLLHTVGQLVDGGLQALKLRALEGVPLPSLPLSAPSTPLNTAVTSDRVFRGAVMPLTRLQRIRQAVGGATINDVVLAICAGALRLDLEQRRDFPKNPLIAAGPISVRSDADRETMGNRVSAMLVSLATDEDDPLKRLHIIHDNAADAMNYSQAVGYDRLTELIPASLAAPIIRLYYQLKLAQRIGPLFNLFITNVPGPRQPLYLHGAPMITHLGMAPVIDGMGLILVVTSYLDTLAISVTACRDILPDPDAFIRYLEESLTELETASEKHTQ